MSALREILARFGVEFDSKELDRGHASIEGTVHRLEQLGQVIAGSLIVEGIRRFVEGIVETGVELEHTSIKMGVTTDQLQELQYAAKQSGVGADEFSMAMTRLGRNLALGGPQAKQITAEFAKFGIQAKDSTGHARNAADVLPDIAEAFTRITNPSERAAFAMGVFGRGGAALIPLLAKGREGLAGMAAEARELGGGLSEDAVGGAVAMHEAANRLDFAFLGLKSRIAVAILPALTQFVEYITRGIVKLQEIARHTNVVQALLTVLGGGGVAAVFKLLGGFHGLWSILGAVIMRLVLPVLLIDELITTFEGGDTIIRRVIDHLFGIGATAAAIEKLKDAWDFFFDVIVPAAADVVKATFNAIGDVINFTIDQWKYLFQSLGDVWNAIINAMPEPVKAILEGIKADFEAAFNWIADKITAAINKVLPLHDLFASEDEKANAKARAEARARDNLPADPRDAAALAGVSGPRALIRLQEREAARQKVEGVDFRGQGTGTRVTQSQLNAQTVINVHGNPDAKTIKQIDAAAHHGVRSAYERRAAVDALAQRAPAAG